MFRPNGPGTLSALHFEEGRKVHVIVKMPIFRKEPVFVPSPQIPHSSVKRTLAKLLAVDMIKRLKVIPDQRGVSVVTKPYVIVGMSHRLSAVLITSEQRVLRYPLGDTRCASGTATTRWGRLRQYPYPPVGVWTVPAIKAKIRQGID